MYFPNGNVSVPFYPDVFFPLTPTKQEFYQTRLDYDMVGVL